MFDFFCYNVWPEMLQQWYFYVACLMMIFLTKVDDDLLLDLECCNCKIEMLHLPTPSPECASEYHRHHRVIFVHFQISMQQLWRAWVLPMCKLFFMMAMHHLLMQLRWRICCWVLQGRKKPRRRIQHNTDARSRLNWSLYSFQWIHAWITLFYACKVHACF